nr:unnamed protein product [Digitaria exilis]
MGVRSRSKSKRRRRATTLTTGASTGGGGADLISDLSDELLVRILELLPKARDAVRTAALSRRWRGLWTRVPSLRFVSHPRGRRDFGNPISPCQFAAFVDRTLALRATQKEPPLAHLAISFDIFEFEQEEEEDLDVPLYIQATQRWIHHAIQHGVRSLVFTLDLPWPADEEGGDDDNNYYVGNPVITLDDLISSANLETMHLDFNHATLRLPSTAVFASLADLSIENIEIEDDSGVQHLTRLVSSACCPRLRKLRLVEVVFPMEETFLIDAGALLELSMEVIDELQFLELKTPSLRVLHMDGCYELEALTR